MSFPPVVLSLILMVGFGAGLGNVILAIIVVDWTRFCRVVRSEVLIVMKRDYIPAARLLGFSHARMILREVLPAVTPLLLTLVSIEMGIAVIVEAILSFVGLSVEPDVPAWGVMIADARQTMYQARMGPHRADPRHLRHRARRQSAGRRLAAEPRSAPHPPRRCGLMQLEARCYERHRG